MNTTVPPVPQLDVDALARSRGWRPKASHLIERQIVWALLHHLEAEIPHEDIVVDDGAIRTVCDTPKDAMELIFDLDDSHVCVGRQWVFLVQGNGEDIISDYTLDQRIEAAVDAAMKHVGLD